MENSQESCGGGGGGGSGAINECSVFYFVNSHKLQSSGRSIVTFVNVHSQYGGKQFTNWVHRMIKEDVDYTTPVVSDLNCKRKSPRVIIW